MLNLGSIQLPLSAATKSFAILAKRGAGKSYTAGVMQEEMYKNGIPFVTFDPIDVHWGLRLKANGKDQAFPIVVFGVLENADIQLTDDMGIQIARAVVEKNISCVISTFGMSKTGQRKLIADFSEELIKINNTPRHIFIEEAHEYVPQRVGSDIARCYSAVEALVVMGRNRGLGVTLINQRAATINKDVLTQIDTLLAFRNISPQDRKALREWVEVHADTKDFDKFWQSLPSLPTGEGWLWSPEWLEKFERIKIRKRETLHPDREKMSGAFEMPVLDQVDVQSFITSFTKKVEKKTKKKVEVIGRVKHISTDKLIETDKKATTAEGAFDHKFIIEEDPRDKRIEELEKEVSRLNRIINNATRVLRGDMIENSPVSQDKHAVYDMWLNKIGRENSAGKMLQLLIDKQGLKLTRHQVRTLLGISSKSSGFSTAVRLLQRNNLIKIDGDCIVLNDELY